MQFDGGYSGGEIFGGPSELMVGSDIFTSDPPTKGVTAVLAHF